MLTPRQLLIPVAAALLPVALFTAVVLALFDQQERARVEQQLTTAAAMVAGAVDRQLQRELAALSGLASAESLDTGDYAAFDRHARRAVAASGTWLSVVLADAATTRVNTRRPPGTANQPLLYPDQIKAVIEEGRSVISGILDVRDRFTEAVVSLRVPVRREGAVRYALSAPLSPTVFLAALAEARVGLAGGNGHPSDSEGRVLLLDRERRVIARMPSAGAADTLVGRPAAEALELPPTLPGGVIRVRAADGASVFIATAVAPLSGWVAVVALPDTEFSPRVEGTEWAIHLGALAALLLAVILGAVMIRSLTRRQEAELRLEALNREKAAEQRLSDIAANLPGVIFRREQSPAGEVFYTYVSGGVSSVLNLPDSTTSTIPAAAMDVVSFMTPQTREQWTAALHHSARTLEPMRVEGALADRNGRIHHFRSQAETRRLPDGRIIWDGVLLDITDQFEATRRGQEQAERLAVALECAGAGLWDWDLRGARLTWSDSLWSLFGFAAPLARPSLSVLNSRIDPEDRDGFWQAINTAAETATPLYVEFRFRRPDGSLRWAASIGRVFADDDDGRAARMTGITLDITEQKRTREELRQAKEEAERANIAKSKFLAAASHDLRQPVQSLLFFIHVLGERLAGHSARPLVQTMEQALDALKGLLDGILDLSKLDAGVVVPVVEPFAVGTLLSRLEAQYAGQFAAKGLELTVVPSAVPVVSDPTLLGRILGNLIENAWKYTDEGRVLVGCRRTGGRLRIEVWDTGPGIPADQYGVIFDEFVQIGNPERDRAQGLGLGLAIVRRLSALLEHPVTVRSRPGHGSVFTVDVPRAIHE